MIKATRYTDGTLAIIAYDDEDAFTATVNLSSYGLWPDKNSVFVPVRNKDYFNDVDGSFEDEPVPYGPFDSQALVFHFTDDMETAADMTISGLGK